MDTKIFGRSTHRVQAAPFVTDTATASPTGPGGASSAALRAVPAEHEGAVHR